MFDKIIRAAGAAALGVLMVACAPSTATSPPIEGGDSGGTPVGEKLDPVRLRIVAGTGSIDAASMELLGVREGPDLLVVVFTSTTCPVANASIPELRRIHERTIESKGRMVLVHPDPLATEESVARHGREAGLQAVELLDPEHRLVGVLGAAVVPEAFVMTRDGDGVWGVCYRGPVDNLYADIGRRRRRATQWHVRSALDAIAAGKAVEVATRPPVGCRIERWRP